MRILHVIRTLNPAWGGPVEGLRNISRQAALRGHDVHILALDDPSSGWLPSWKAKVHAVGDGWPPGGIYGFTPRLDQWLNANLPSFDRVIVHSIWMYFSYAVWRATRNVSVPYYLFIHGALDPWFKKRYPLKHIKKSLYWKLIEHSVFRDAAAVLFTTQEEMLQADGAFSPYSCRAEVIGYGIEPIAPPNGFEKQTLTAAHPLLEGRPYILSLGRVHEKKGIDILLKAFAASKYNLHNTALVVAGPGEPNYIASLKALAATLKIEGDVIWTGPLYGDMKFNAMRAADAYALPSHQENFGISVVEALACGTPVLISDKVNIWREVQAAGAGFVEPDDVEGTTRLLLRWAEMSPNSKLLMRGPAEECFTRHFDIRRTCERLFQVVLENNETRAAAS